MPSTPLTSGDGDSVRAMTGKGNRVLRPLVAWWICSPHLFLWELGALWRAHPSFVFLERGSCLIVWHVLKMLGVVSKFSVSSRPNWDYMIYSRPTRGTWEDPTSKYHHHNHYYYYGNYCNKRRHHILFWLFGLRVLRQVMHDLFECMYTGMHICLSVYLCV